MKATVETPRRPRQLITNMDNLLTGHGDTVAHSRSSLIAVERVGGVLRVRLSRVKQTNGSILIDGRAQPMKVVTTSYLDGAAREVATAGSYDQETEVALAAIPARSEDVTDFGRLTRATKAQAVAMSEFGAKNPPSPEQLTVFVAGYRSLLEWREMARRRMTEAEGQIDVIEAMLSTML